MTDRLVALTAPEDREAALGLAHRLLRVGIASVLVPEPVRPGAFRVSVAEAAAAEAARWLATWRRGSAPAADPYRGIPYRGMVERREEDEPLPTRQRKLAAFFALGLGFGLGHVYAREYLAGLIVALGQIACLALSARGIDAAVWAFPALMLLDAFGAARAVDRENAGWPRPSAAQLAATLPAVALLVASAAVLLPRSGGAAEAERPGLAEGR